MRPLVLVLVCLAPARALGDAASYYEDALALVAEGERTAAIIQLRNAVQDDRDHVPSWVLMAKLQLEMGDPAAALHSATEAARLGADVELTTVLRARSFLMLGDLDGLLGMPVPARLSREQKAAFLRIQGEALLEANELREGRRRFDAVLALFGDDPGALRGIALIESRRARHDSALRFAERAIAADPGEAESHYVRGEVRRGRRDLGLALTDFAKALELQPSHAPAMLGQAAILIDLGRVEEAHEMLLEYRELAPDELYGLYLLSQVQLARGEDLAAEFTLDSAREVLARIPPDSAAENLPVLLVSAAIALRDDLPQVAHDQLQAFLERSRGHVGATKLLAVALLRLGDGAGARKHLTSLRRAFPDDPHLKLLLGAAYALEGKVEEARSLSIEVGGADRAWFHKLLGLAEARAGHLNEALAAFDTALQLDRGAQDASLMAAYTQIQMGRPKEALAILEAVMETEPGNAAYENLAGSLHLMLGDHVRAARHFEFATLADPEFPAPRLNLAELARQLGRYAEARERYAALTDVESTRLAAIRGLAEVAASEGDVATAVGWLERLRKLAPDRLDDRLVLARYYLNDGRVQEAVRETRELLALGAKSPKFRAVAAVAEDRAGNKGRAREILLDAAASPRLTAASAALIADTQSELGMLSDARRTRLASVARWPDDHRNRYRLAIDAMRAGDLEKAARHVDALGGAGPESHLGHLAAGELALARGNASAAVTAFERALALESSRAVRRRLAVALGEAGQVERAVQLLDEAAAGSSARERDLAVAALLVRAGRYAEAAARYERILATAPDDWQARNNLAWVYQKLSDPRALGEVRRVLASNGTNPAVLDTAGWVLARHGEREEALRLLREALARDSREPSIRLHLGEVLLELGQDEEARTHLEFAVQGGRAEIAEAARSLLGHDAPGTNQPGL